jgi:hypothetical protein
MNLNFQAFQGMTTRASHFLLENSPTILTGIVVGGTASTLVLAVEGGRRAMRIENAEMAQREKDAMVEGNGEMPEDLTLREVLELTWKCYVPAAVMGGLTITSAIMANTINQRRNAALAGLYSLAETGLKEYREKVIETLGEKKEAKIREEMLQDKMTKDPVTNKEIIITGNGETLCYDTLSGRYFKGNLENIRRIQNDFNMHLHHEMYRTLNELYDDLGLEHTELGNNLGWSTDHALLNIDFSAKLTNDGQPCIVLEFRVGPRKL